MAIAMERVIPDDASRPLRGEVFADFENHVHAAMPSLRRLFFPPQYRDWALPVEAGVKQFNKRVKGTEQFWSYPGAEAVLSLRALLLSQDGRWDAYWSHRPAYLKRPA